MTRDNGRPVKSRSVRVAAAAFASLVVVLVVTAAFVYSGVYDIAATSPHYDFTFRVLRTTMEQSVKRQARHVKVPELDDPEKVHLGFKNFHEMCVVCHGAPGAAPSQLSKGLYPEAPDLVKSAAAWKPAELYVIVRDGIKMSGMPAWSPTHSGEELWAIVAFLKVLPTMPSTEYQEAVAYYETNAAAQDGGQKLGHH